MSLKRYARYNEERKEFEKAFFDFFKKHPLATQVEFAEHLGLHPSTVTLRMQAYGLVLKNVPDRLSTLAA